MKWASARRIGLKLLCRAPRGLKTGTGVGWNTKIYRRSSSDKIYWNFVFFSTDCGRVSQTSLSCYYADTALVVGTKRLRREFKDCGAVFGFDKVKS